MFKKRKKGDLEIKIMIMQNGQPIADTHCSLSSNRKLFITSKDRGPLSLPLYPLADDIKIVEIHRGKAHLFIADRWEGFIVSEGKIIELDPTDRNERTFALIRNDYASIQFDDLEVLIKIETSKNDKDIPLDPTYAPKLLSLFIHDKLETKSLAIATLIGFIFLATATSLLWFKEFKRPTRFDQLATSYTLPFIHEDNLQTAPEALKENLNRSDYISSVVRYYRYFFETYLGSSFKSNPYILPLTVKRFKQLHSDEKQRLFQQIDENREILALETKVHPILVIPSIMGQSYQIQTLKLISQINNVHESMKLRLKSRRRTSLEFLGDPHYDWTNYSDLGLKSIEGLSKIAVFNRRTNQDAMYKEANALGFKARILNYKYETHREKQESLTPETIKPIFISHKQKYALISNAALNEIDDKIFSLIAASRQIKSNKYKFKEPIIGKISKNLLTDVIEKNRYKLNLCYEKALRRDHTVNGHIDIGWRLESTGEISEIAITKTTIKDSLLIRCIQNTLETWKFPKPKKGSIKISHSFVFKPQSG